MSFVHKFWMTSDPYINSTKITRKPVKNHPFFSLVAVPDRNLQHLHSFQHFRTFEDAKKIPWRQGSCSKFRFGTRTPSSSGPDAPSFRISRSSLRWFPPAAPGDEQKLEDHTSKLYIYIHTYIYIFIRVYVYIYTYTDSYLY